MSVTSVCTLCPRACGVDRSVARGFCGEGEEIRISKIAPHFFEEPPISGTRGSGAIFFSGCSLGCIYCQNKAISQKNSPLGKIYTEEELAEEMLRLQAMGVHNINLVTPTHFSDKIASALEFLKAKSLLKIPVVYNTSGYESIDTLKTLDGLVDIYMPDLKYFSSELSQKYSFAPDYFEVAVRAIGEMLRQRGKYRYADGEPILSSGVLIRHLVLPSHRKDSIKALSRLAELINPADVLLSVMSQYTPDFALDSEHTELHRRITSFEYDSVCRAATELGFDGFTQSRDSASKSYTPSFTL